MRFIYGKIKPLMNKNWLVMVYNQVLRFFVVIKSEWDSLHRMANEEQPSKIEIAIKRLPMKFQMIYFIKNTSKWPNIRSKIITKIMFMNSFRWHIISRLSHILSILIFINHLRCSNHGMCRCCFRTKKST